MGMMLGGVRPDVKGKCIRKESFGCPEGTPKELGCSPRKIATEYCYDNEGKVISKKPLNFNEPYQTKSSSNSVEPRVKKTPLPVQKSSTNTKRIMLAAGVVGVLGVGYYKGGAKGALIGAGILAGAGVLFVMNVGRNM